MSERDHYSNKGSHKKRSDYWKAVRRETKRGNGEPVDDSLIYEIIAQASLTKSNETTNMEYSHPNYETRRPQELE